MDIILHIGAHRCATTSFQHYLRANATRLAAQGLGFWGPWRTRAGLLRGLIPGPGPARGDPQRRAKGRIALNLAQSEDLGLTRLLISEENMMGSVRENLRLGELYSGVGERLARYHQGFGGQVSDVLVNTRSPESYWASAAGYAVARGYPVPGQAALTRLAGANRSWRDVITDIACAMPGARIRVAPFESYAGCPEAQLATLTGLETPRIEARAWLNATPRLADLRGLVGPKRAIGLPQGDGRWQPFSPAQMAALRETYADDMMWLAAGGDGLARLLDEPNRTKAGLNPPPTDMTRGRRNDNEERRMAGTG